MADDLGWRDVGYHSADIKTPNINRLSGEGVRLEQHYSLSLCAPSRASFLTGRYQTGTGYYMNVPAGVASGLPVNLPTMADLLHDAGYVTYMTGKWHLSFYKKDRLPWNRGFDHFFGILGGKERSYYDHQLCQNYAGKKVCGHQLYRDGKVVKVKGEHSTNVYGAAASDYIKQHSERMRTLNDTRPMFMFVSFLAPHAPLNAVWWYVRTHGHLKNKERRKYAGLVSQMDAWIGNIQHELMQQGMWKNTILVFTSDNGGDHRAAGRNYPLRGGKNMYFEGGIRTPTFVASPLLDKPNRVHMGLTHITDWFPTFLRLAGYNFTNLKLDGMNQWDAISEGQPSPRTEVLLGLDLSRPPGKAKQHDLPCDTCIRGAIRRGPYKLLTGAYKPLADGWKGPGLSNNGWSRDPPDTSLRLYDVISDPYEQNNLSAQMPGKVLELCEKLRDYATNAAPPLKRRRVDPKSRPKGGVFRPWTQ